MKYLKFLLVFLLLIILINPVDAQEIPDIVDDSTEDSAASIYRIRNDAFVVVLYHVPDGSGELIMNLCNKQGHCRQTSMQPDEIRYIGLFLEDSAEILFSELAKDINNNKKYIEQQYAFREFYADYMNNYDKTHGALKSIVEK